ncbi:MAG: hypothetical protein QM736_05935 [Vicinamibacterales bacterium]
MRQILKIICYVVAGFFCYMVALLAFMTIPGVGAGKFLIMGMFSLPAGGAFALGLALAPRGKRLRDAGIVFLAAGGFVSFCVLTFVSLVRDEQFRGMFPPELLAMYRGYVAGFGFLSVLVIAGAGLLWAGLRSARLSDASR